LSDSFAEAVRLASSWCGAEHVALMLVRGDDTVAQVFREAGVTPEAVEDLIRAMASKRKPFSGASANPHWHEVHGRALGFAAALGNGVVEPIHVAYALLWEPHAWLFERLGISRGAIVAELESRGFDAPPGAAPEPDLPAPHGQVVHFPADRMPDVLAAMHEASLEPGSWGFNVDTGGGAWVSADEAVDVRAIVREALGDGNEWTFRGDGHAAIEWAARYLERVDELPVLAQVKPGELSAKLPLAPPEQGEPFANVLRDLDELIVPALTNWQHPRFFAYFAVTASEPGILAELLAATLNQVALLWRASPASTELEIRTVDWVRQLLGLPAGWHGHIEDTASTSTLAALIAARYITGRNVVVCSEHAHSSVEKAARMLGMELRKIGVDDALGMRTDGLELGDVAAVVATVGTTSFAAVDPVRELAGLAHAAGAWLHVDAAYAGSSWICEEERASQDGVELADSLVINPHKWLMVPMDCSLLWTSRPDELRTAFSLTPEYLRTGDDAYALSDYGPALGRRFRSLKLWAVLRCYGRAGLQQMLREHVRLANLFAEWVEADPDWELCAPQRFSLVVFRRNGSDEENERIVERANQSGEMFLSHTKLHDRYVLRLAIGNARTTEADVRRAWDVLNREARA
jgi:aromatic-L-amino-acid decarboxylase